MAALTGKMEGEVEIKSNGDDIFHMCAGKISQHTANLCPEKIHRVDLHEGEWGNHGSIKVWTFVADGEVETYKEKVSINEENKTVHLTALEGHLLQVYKSYNIIYQFIRNSETNIVKITRVREEK